MTVVSEAWDMCVQLLMIVVNEAWGIHLLMIMVSVVHSGMLPFKMETPVPQSFYGTGTAYTSAGDCGK